MTLDREFTKDALNEAHLHLVNVISDTEADEEQYADHVAYCDKELVRLTNKRNEYLAGIKKCQERIGAAQDAARRIERLMIANGTGQLDG